MKNKILTGLMVAGLMLGGATFSAFAQGGPAQGQGGKGKGYGGPPQSQEERVARQAACLEKNGGICPNGGPRTNCPAGAFGQGKGFGKGQCKGLGKGMGMGKGRGHGAGHWGRHGLRDGTGPRSANGTCPNAPAAQQK